MTAGRATKVDSLVCLSADAARFNCENSKVSVGERNVCLVCKVRAQPTVTSLYWIVDDNSTVIYEGDVVDGYWTLVLVRLVSAARRYTITSITRKCEAGRILYI